MRLVVRPKDFPTANRLEPQRQIEEPVLAVVMNCQHRIISELRPTTVLTCRRDAGLQAASSYLGAAFASGASNEKLFTESESSLSAVGESHMSISKPSATPGARALRSACLTLLLQRSGPTRSDGGKLTSTGDGGTFPHEAEAKVWCAADSDTRGHIFISLIWSDSLRCPWRVIEGRGASETQGRLRRLNAPIDIVEGDDVPTEAMLNDSIDRARRRRIPDT